MKTRTLESGRDTSAAEVPWRQQAAAAIAAAFFFLAPTQLIGIVGTIIAAAQLALAGLLIFVVPKSALRACVRWWPVLALPLITVASAFWSSAPDVSFRYGAQFLLTCFVGTTLAVALPIRLFLSVFLVTALAFCVASIASQIHGVSATGMVLIGLTGSKNQMGNEAQIALLAALLTLFDARSSARLRLVALAVFPIGGYLLIQANAATPLLLAVFGSVVAVGYALSTFLQPAGRAAAVLGLILVGLPLTALAPEGVRAANDFTANVLNKDPTLTGRTYLWAKADDLAQRRPLLGYGYQAIWVGDSSDTIGLLRWAGIEDGRTFHFHDTYRQIRVDTGLLGLGAFLCLLIAAGLGQAAIFFLRPTMAAAFFFVFFLTTLIRAPTEVFLGPFSIQTILLFACAVYSVKGLREAVSLVQRNPPIRAAVASAQR